MSKPNHEPHLVSNLVEDLARKVRRQCEHYVKMDDSGAFDDNLGNMCAVASGALFQALSRKGIKVSFIKGHYLFQGNDRWGNHCWVMVEDQVIVDITATQFGDLPQVLICSVHDGHYYNEAQFDNWVEIQVALQDWDDQRPTRTKALSILKIAA